ncbi:DUF2169 domain-containing protein [Litorilituus sediminis]|uniref:DUF2169 domain-containing protein n=1 Tax=Litorilituus sediminis TaxID=718192 RepID=UPI0014778539|nr:DUF2169 domain-containing protein [Litorilituus sediminis]
MLHNLTSWQAIVVDNWLASKQACKTLIVKQSFEFDQQGQVFALETSANLELTDQMSAEPSASSLALACETVPFKQGFELYGNLTAYPPKHKQAKVIEVSLSLHQQQQTVFNKVLRVTGDRHWKSSILGSKATDPEVLHAVALSYENTYGGIDEEKPERIFEQNPVGIGFRVKQIKASPLPKVEYPNSCLTHPKNIGVVASYGPIPQFWQPRLSLMPEVEPIETLAGNYPFQAPLLANSYNYAPTDQQLALTYNQELSLSLKGLVPNRDYHDTITLKLPYDKPIAACIQGEHQQPIELTCDTLVLDSDANTFHLLWRKSIASEEISASAIMVVQQQEKTANNIAEPSTNSAVEA